VPPEVDRPCRLGSLSFLRLTARLRLKMVNAVHAAPVAALIVLVEAGTGNIEVGRTDKVGRTQA